MSDGAAVPADANYDVVDAETGEVIKITGEEAKLLDEDEEEGEDVGGGLVIGIDRRDGVESTVGAIEAAEAAAATPAPPAVDLARCSFTGHSGPVYSTRGTDAALGLALSGGGDDAAYLWDVATGAVRHALTGHVDSIVAVGLNCDGSIAATASLDSSVKVWSVASGELLHTLEGPSEDVVWMTWHQKGNVVLAGSSDGTAWMWHVAPATATILVSTAPATAGAASVSTLLTIISKMPGCTAAMVSSTHAGPCFAASKHVNTTRHLVNLGVLLV